MIAITKHAYKRAKERLGWNKKALERMAPVVLADGIRIGQTSGPFRRYLDSHIHKGHAVTLRIYGRFIFLFTDDCMLTILDLPHKYENQVDSLQAK